MTNFLSKLAQRLSISHKTDAANNGIQDMPIASAVDSQPSRNVEDIELQNKEQSPKQDIGSWEDIDVFDETVKCHKGVAEEVFDLCNTLAIAANCPMLGDFYSDGVITIGTGEYIYGGRYVKVTLQSQQRYGEQTVVFQAAKQTGGMYYMMFRPGSWVNHVVALHSDIATIREKSKAVWNEHRLNEKAKRQQEQRGDFGRID